MWGLIMSIDTQIHDLVCELFFAGDSDFQLELDENFVESGICDSLGLVRLATALEATFPEIRIHDQEINRDTIGSLDLLSTFISSKLDEI
jgi:acyl carrier protein